MSLHIVEPTSPAQFEQYYQLRWEVLRKPWQQPMGSERDAPEREAEAVHAMCLDENDTLCGVACLHYTTATEAQVRYMAVADAWQRRGKGSLLLLYLESKALNQGITSIFLNTREVAVPFYTANGYTIEQDGPLMFGVIKHFVMRKSLKQ